MMSYCESIASASEANFLKENSVRVSSQKLGEDFSVSNFVPAEDVLPVDFFELAA